MASSLSASWTIFPSRESGVTESVPLNETWSMIPMILSCTSMSILSESMKRLALAWPLSPNSFLSSASWSSAASLTTSMSPPSRRQIAIARSWTLTVCQMSWPPLSPSKSPATNSLARE